MYHIKDSLTFFCLQIYPFKIIKKADVKMNFNKSGKCLQGKKMNLLQNMEIEQ